MRPRSFFWAVAAQAGVTVENSNTLRTAAALFLHAQRMSAEWFQRAPEPAHVALLHRSRTRMLMTKEIKAPNGIAFSPDGKRVYVSNADPRNAVWMTYDVKADSTFANGSVFFDATARTTTKKAYPTA